MALQTATRIAAAVLACAVARSAEFVAASWDATEGLPSLIINTIVQTHDGYLWLGTKRGLVRFDGLRFTLFDRSQVRGIRETGISALLQTADGTLWIGGERGGVCRYRDRTFRPVEDPRLTDEEITGIFGGLGGTVWITTRSGLWRMAGGNPVRYSLPPALPESGFSAALEDRRGALWFGHPQGGLVRIQDGASRTFTTTDGLPARAVLELFEDSNGVLWVGTSRGLARFDGTRFRHVLYRGTAVPKPRAFAEDHHRELLVGTDAGIFRIRNGVAAPLEHRGAALRSTIGCLWRDREDNIWAGVKHEGLVRLSEARVKVYTGADGLSHDSVKTVIEGRDGSLWIGSNRGLSRLRDGRITPLGGPLAEYVVRSIAQDHNGSLWIATGGSVFHVPESNGRSVRRVPDAPPGTTLLASGRDGDLWAGTRTGLFRQRDGHFVRYAAHAALSTANIRALLAGTSGEMWVATTRGVFRIGSDSNVVSVPARDPSGDDAASLLQTRDGAIWIGYTDRGLGRWHGGKLAYFGPEEGLFDDAALSLLEDSNGNIWVGGGAGIYRISTSDITRFERGQTASLRYTSIGHADGLESIGARGGNQPAAWRTSDGRLWFATVHGIVMIDPRHMRLNEVPPPVVIEAVTANSRSLNLNDSLRVSPGPGNLEIRYTGLSLANPSAVRFRYRLAGFDDQWIDAGSRRQANYTNLPPGKYEFQVVATNNDGASSASAASLSIVLDPAFYQTHTFLAVCVFALLAAGWTWHRRRLARQQAMFAMVLNERTRIAREIHDTIMQGVSGISAQLEAVSGMVSGAPPAAQRHIERVREQARSIVDEARRSIWDLRPGSLDQASLVSALNTLARTLVENRQVKLEVNAEGAFVPLSDKTERSLLRIVQEAVSNAVEHARATQIVVDLRFDQATLDLRVADNGCGFDPSAAAADGHFGLMGMRERSAELGGRIDVRSAPGNGTTVHVSVPLQSPARLGASA